MNIIDSRDLINQFEELQNELNGLEEALDEAATRMAEAEEEDNEEARNSYEEACFDLKAFDNEEYERLKAICEVGEDTFEDWSYGVALIHDSYFVQYAQEFAEDVGAINKTLHKACWPYTCLDWNKAADELKMDYSSIEIDGHTYWGR